MKVIVVDASVALKWFLEEIHTDAARRLFDNKHVLCVPDFFLLEMDNALLKKAKRKEISENDSREARALLRTMPLNYYPFSAVLDNAYPIAIKTNCSLYDAVYLALAVQLNGQMVTGDRRLVNSLLNGPYAKYLVWVEEI